MRIGQALSAAKGNKSVKKADDAIANWCAVNGVRLHSVRHVLTWEDWDDGIGVYFFLKADSDVRRLGAEKLEEMKRFYLASLKKAGYPFRKFPNVVFEIDSDENVRKVFSGNCFNRLR